MKYTQIADVPQPVRTLLVPELQQKWLDYSKEVETDNAAWEKLLSEVTDSEYKFKSTSGYSYTAPIAAIKLDATSDAAWIQAMPLGKYVHPLYGEIDFTPERIQQFASNVNNQVRGAELDIDYEHKEGVEGGRAAGWVKGAEARSDGLWIRVQWTARARQAIQDGEYKYFSPEFDDEWTDPKSQQTFKHVLFGGALTNRPFLRDILPVNFSELAKGDAFGVKADKTKSNGPDKGVYMEELLKALRAQLKLSDDADEKAIQAAFESAIANAASNEAAVASLAQLHEVFGTGVDTAKLLTEAKSVKEAATKKAEADDKAKKFAEMFPEEAARLKAQEEDIAKLTLADKESKVTLKLSEWKKHPESKRGIPSDLYEPVKAFAMGLSDDTATKFNEIMDKLLKSGIVQFGEKGADSVDSFNTDENGFIEYVKQLQEKAGTDDNGRPKLAYRDAVAQAANDKPELAAAWRNARSAVSGSRGGE